MLGSEARLSGSWLLPSHHGRSGTPMSALVGALVGGPDRRRGCLCHSSPLRAGRRTITITATTMSSAIAEVHAGVRRGRARLDRLARDRRNDSPLYPQYIAATIAKLADNDAVFIFNIGTPSIWAAHLT